MGTIIDRLTGLGLSERAARAIAGLGFFLIILLLIAAFVTVSRCSSRRQERAQARVDVGQSGAFTNSTADAIAAEQAAHARENASQQLSRTNEEEIRNANGASASVDPAVRDAGLRSLCRRAAYRDSARCKLLDAPPR
jgi:type II secretory pathway component PulM